MWFRKKYRGLTLKDGCSGETREFRTSRELLEYLLDEYPSAQGYFQEKVDEKMKENEKDESYDTKYIMIVKQEDAPKLINLLDSTKIATRWHLTNENMSSLIPGYLKITYRSGVQLLFQEGDNVVFKMPEGFQMKTVDMSQRQDTDRT